MNRKQLTILIVVGLALGGLGVVLTNKQSSTWQAGGAADRKKVLGDFPLNDVAQVRIKTATNELNLAVREETWRVQERWDHPASFSEVSDLIRKLWELKPVRNIKIGSSQLGRLELLDPGKGANSGTLIELKDKSGKLIKSLLLGKKEIREGQNDSPMGMGGGGFPVGRYVMAPDSPAQVWIVSEAFSDIEPKPESWLSKEFLKVEKLKSIAVTAAAATNSWKVTRETETGAWALADAKEGEQADSGKTSSLNYLLSSPSFNDLVAPDTKPETIGMDKPVVAALETFEGFSYAVKLAKKDEENYHLHIGASGTFPKERAPGKDEKPEDKDKLDKEFKEKTDKLEAKLKTEKAFEKWTYLVSKWTVDALLKERKDLLAEKIEEPKKDEPKADASPLGDLLPSIPKPGSPTPAEIKIAPVPPPIPPLPEKKDPKPAENLPPAPDKPAPKN